MLNLCWQNNCLSTLELQQNFGSIHHFSALKFQLCEEMCQILLPECNCALSYSVICFNLFPITYNLFLILSIYNVFVKMAKYICLNCKMMCKFFCQKSYSCSINCCTFLYIFETFLISNFKMCLSELQNLHICIMYVCIVSCVFNDSSTREATIQLQECTILALLLVPKNIDCNFSGTKKSY